MGDAYGSPNKFWNGVLLSGRTVILVRTNLAQRIANEIAGDVAEYCMPVFVSTCVWQHRASLCLCLYTLSTNSLL